MGSQLRRTYVLGGNPKKNTTDARRERVPYQEMYLIPIHRLQAQYFTGMSAILLKKDQEIRQRALRHLESGNFHEKIHGKDSKLYPPQQSSANECPDQYGNPRDWTKYIIDEALKIVGFYEQLLTR